MNLEPENTKLIRTLFQVNEFFDLAHSHQNVETIDVIVPVLHSNDLWRENLTSFYREIPINRLIIGDAGCIDDTIAVVREFPRVDVVDHKEISTLGSSIADLIGRVVTPKFAYLQSDVYLPPGWFAAMEKEGQKFAWVGSPMQVVTMLDYRLDYSGRRPLAGAQLGDTSVFSDLGKFIDDDYVYRQEDFVLEEFVKHRGFKTGNSLDTFHYHQVMRRKTLGMQMNVQGISINLGESTQEKNRVSNTQLFGLIKYCDSEQSEVRLAAYAAYQDQNLSHFVRYRNARKFAKLHGKKWSSLMTRFAVKALIVRATSIFNSAVLRITDKILGIR